MTSTHQEFDRVVAELQEQGLSVMVRSVSNETWYVRGDGMSTGYVASGAEMLELKRKNELNLRGIQSLG